MARKKYKTKPPQGEPWETGGNSTHFARVFDGMTDSIAWQALSPRARLIYVALKMAYAGPKESPGRIVNAGQRYIERITGVRREHITGCLIELELYGFVELVPRESKRKPQRVRFVGKWMGVGAEDLSSIQELMQQYKRGRRGV